MLEILLEREMSEPKTLFDKIWDTHLIHRDDDGSCLIYIDRHLVHEVVPVHLQERLCNIELNIAVFSM